jgi:hypothetical protein
MAQSQVIDWVFENGYRMYPFTELSSRVAGDGFSITTNMVLDLNLYVPGYPIVAEAQLLSIVRSGNAVTLNFSGSNAFVIADVTAVSYPYYLPRLGNGSNIVIGKDIIMVTSGTHTFSSLYVEPALVYELSNAWLGVTQITVSPEYQSDESNTPYYSPVLPLVAQEATTVLTGDILLLEGYNFDINFSGNAINLGVAVGNGFPLTCDDEFIASEDKDCGEIISFINGVPPDSQGKFNLLGGTNIEVVEGTSEDNFEDTIDTDAASGILANPHSVFVEMTFATTDICAPILLVPPTK